MLAKLGILLFILSFMFFFISESYHHTKALLFFGSWIIGTGLILLHICLTGIVPLRGKTPWPNFKKNLFLSVFGLIIYLALFIAMLKGFILSLMQ